MNLLKKENGGGGGGETGVDATLKLPLWISL